MNVMSILKKLENFRQLDGYLGAGVFSSDGIMLAGMTEVSGVNFEIAGKLFHDAFLFTNNNSREAGFGRIDTLQVEAELGVVLAKCCSGGEDSFHTIVVVSNETNLAMAKMLLNKVAESLKPDFREDLDNWAQPRVKQKQLKSRK